MLALLTTLAVAVNAEELVSISLTLVGSGGGDGPKKTLALHEGTDPEHAAFEFCAAHNLRGERVTASTAATDTACTQDHTQGRHNTR